MIPYSFHPEAEAELSAAAEFYESRVAGLGRLFSAEVQRTIWFVRAYPDVGAAVQLRIRRALVDRFPYARWRDFIVIDECWLDPDCVAGRATPNTDDLRSWGGVCHADVRSQGAGRPLRGRVVGLVARSAKRADVGLSFKRCHRGRAWCEARLRATVMSADR